MADKEKYVDRRPFATLSEESFDKLQELQLSKSYSRENRHGTVFLRNKFNDESNQAGYVDNLNAKPARHDPYADLDGAMSEEIGRTAPRVETGVNAMDNTYHGGPTFKPAKRDM